MKALRRSCRLLVAVLLLAVAPAAAAFKYAEVGQEAPDFTCETLAGESLRLKEKTGAKALAVVFWATWSARSQPLLEDLETLYRERKDQGFELIAVNVEHEELSAEERKKVEETAARLSYPVVLDRGLETYYRYGVVATPSLALLDEKGTIQYVRASYSTSAREDIRAAVEGLLGLAEVKTSVAVLKKRDYVPPKKATLHYQKAQVLIERGRARRAVKDLEEASKLDPQWADPRVLLARIYQADAGKDPELLEKAEQVLREARGIQPKHLQTLAGLAEVLVARGKSEDGLGVAGEALALEPAYTPALLAKARGLRALGKLDQAAAVVKEAFDLDPRNPEILLEKGELAAAQGRWAEAAESLRQAVESAFAARRREG